MGAHGPRARTEERVRPLSPAGAKPPADRLYGRLRGHTLRPRQERLLELALPRLRLSLDQAVDPAAAFAQPPVRLALEIGFGGGEHAASLIEEPGLGLIACEVFAPGLCSLLSRLLPEGADERTAALPGNLRVWDDDARVLMREMPPACLDLVVLMFPDPWPKVRHAKRRFVHPAQLQLVAGLLKPGGTWRIASDDPSYQAWVTDVMAAQTLFEPAVPTTARPADWPSTRYEAKALRAGRTPRYWCFRRAPGPIRAAGVETEWRETS